MKVEHSTDGGRTWSVIDINDTSLAATVIADNGHYADGFGNWYRKLTNDQ